MIWFYNLVGNVKIITLIPNLSAIYFIDYSWDSFVIFVNLSQMLTQILNYFVQKGDLFSTFI